MGQERRNPREIRLLELANRQSGVLAYAQLRAEGLTANDIDGRVAACRLTRLHRGVYAFGHSALTDRGRWLAALCACGDDVALSHTSVAAYHGWRAEDPDAPVHVTTTRAIRSRPGIVVHRTRHLDRIDLNRPHPLVVTAIPRSLVDLADVLPWTAYRSLADNLSALPVARIREAQRRSPFRPGAPLVTRLLEADDAHTRSAFERRFLAFLRAHGLPGPDALNVRVAGHQVDCLYGTARLVVELDGRAYHDRRGRMRADRRRDADHQLAGLRILRLLWDDLHASEARSTAERLRQMLALGGAS